MRKSSPSNAKRGNVRKADSFKEAWARIKDATESGFYLEATAIQESIIFDRLLAYLHRKHQFSLQTQKRRHHPLGSLIKELHKREPEILLRGGGALAAELDAWREKRNAAIHSIVRSDPGTPTRPVEEFLAKARDCAEQGRKLARAVSNLKAPKPSAVVGD